MRVINFLSVAAIPMIILIIVCYGLKERINVFDVFLEGATEGLDIVLKIFPTLLGLFIAIGALRSSGILDLVVQLISPLTDLLRIPSEIMPLAMLRPISGSASIAIGTDIMNAYGVDSLLGNMASIIMGSTETTLYTIAVYTSCVRIKKTRFVLGAALVGDLIGMVVSVFITRLILG